MLSLIAIFQIETAQLKRCQSLFCYYNFAFTDSFLLKKELLLSSTISTCNISKK